MEHSHLVLSILGVITCWASEPSPMLNLYQTVSDSVDIENLLEYDCLDYYVRDDIVRRPSSRSEVQTHGEISPLDASNFTFKELKSRDVTAIQLQQWSATIDIVERYQAYLMGDRMANDSDLYYNCTSPWFGSRCEYALSPWGEMSLAQTVYYTFAYMEMHQPVDVPCYTLLQCDRGPFIPCLDWREICDGKVDCFDGGRDEEYCWQLETSEIFLDGDEYRCHNGMHSVSKEFFRDGFYHPDCLDRSDEQNRLDYWDKCFQDPAFRCEEHACHAGRSEAILACGDGQCVRRWRDCFNERGRLFSSKSTPSNLSMTCWSKVLCLTQQSDSIENKPCALFCRGQCASDVHRDCPAIFLFPRDPVALGHLFFLYTSANANRTSDTILPSHVCYEREKCPTIQPTYLYQQRTCVELAGLNFRFRQPRRWLSLVRVIEQFFIAECWAKTENDCLDSSLHRCANSSKCISKHRLIDGIQDCIGNDDETFWDSCALNQSQRFTCTDDRKRCLSSLMVHDTRRDCPDGEEELRLPWDVARSSVQLAFSTMCDGFRELLPISIDGENHTDETECQRWPCQNRYTRCNEIWNFPNGLDESQCSTPTNHSIDRVCVNWPLASPCPLLFTAGQTDCSYSTNALRSCTNVSSLSYLGFQSWPSDRYLSLARICHLFTGCSTDSNHLMPTMLEHRLFDCILEKMSFLTTVNCRSSLFYKSWFSRPLLKSTIGYEMYTIPRITAKNQRSIMDQNQWTCHRGLVIYHRGVRQQRKCLCPPSYYGDECQYQNQRMAFTVRIAMDDHWRTLFHVVVILVDDRGLIESHDRIVYAPIVDCDAVKFNLYLLYRSRPKNATSNYSVQLHAYNKQGLTYHGSWLFPLRFTFLPVHRMAVHLTIPSDEPERCVFWCGGHGHCFKYVNQNDNGAFYCRCDPGWSGANCTMEHHTCSRCASVSLCVGPHMCVCPLGADGPRCYVPLQTCALPQSKCDKGGTCLAMDRGSPDNPFICLCPPGFSGFACATIDPPILIAFHTRVRIPESVLAHFIILFRDLPLRYKTVFAKIAFDQTSVTLHTDLAFNLAFVVLPPDAYYLTYRSEKSSVSSDPNNTKAVLRMLIDPLRRCPLIHELFNHSFASLHLLRRMKYYQVPCQERPALACFYDELHLCVCTDGYVQREAICVEINHGFQDQCTVGNQGRCQNGGQCLQKASTCPRMLLCVCRECFYGSRCQFSTQRFGLNLDAILGYYIQPNIPFLQQPITVRASALVVTCMLLVGIFESFLALITFQRKAVHDMGCGIYLFYNTLISVVILLLFALKFWLLVLTQMAVITARSFLSIHCQYLDFLLRAFLNTYDWLNACVAIERAFIAFKGISFDKDKSRRLARVVILLVLIITFPSNVHDPLHRQLLDVVEEERTWCVVTDDEFYRVVNLTGQMIHFLVPFSVNLISAVIIIVFAARQRLRVRNEKNYKQHVVEQLQQYKNLLISPCILVLLALPRLVISFLPGCMNFTGDHGLLLTGYMLSFVPCILLFIVFVLPSKIYRKQSLLAIKQLCPRRGFSA